MTDDELEFRVRLLRRLGVVHYKTADLELVLGAEPGPVEVSATEAAPGTRGKDGLTREEQVELYGRAFDDAVLRE